MSRTPPRCHGGVTAVSLRRSRALDKPGVQASSPCTTRRRGRKTDTLPVHFRCALPLCRSHAARPPARPAARRRSAPRPVPGERPTGGQYKESAGEVSARRAAQRRAHNNARAAGQWEMGVPAAREGPHGHTPQTLAAASRSALPYYTPIDYCVIDYCQLHGKQHRCIATSLHRPTPPRQGTGPQNVRSQHSSRHLYINAVYICPSAPPRTRTHARSRRY